MTDAPPPLHPYRVTFLHLVNGVKYTVEVKTPTIHLGRKAGEASLEQHLKETAGALHEWGYYSTAEVT